MNFLYPSFLSALAAIAIPIIIHLFNFRRYKTVLFSDVRFLKDIKKETKAKSQLKDLLILVARILAIVFLVVAFAQPYIPGKSDVGMVKEELVGIYLDNSFSSEAESRNGKILDVAKNRISEIVDIYKADTKYVLLTNDLQKLHQQYISGGELLRFIMDVDASPMTLNLSDALDRLKDFMNEYEGSGQVKKTVIVCSDFQSSTADLQDLNSDTLINTMLLPLSTQFTNNLFIDSCWFENPGRKYKQAEELYVNIVNNSAESLSDVPVNLFINDTLKSVATVTIDADDSKIIKLSYLNTHTGLINGRIELSDYPITFDNDFYFSYRIADKIKILSISKEEKNRYSSALLSSEDYFQLTENRESNINFSSLSAYQLILINELDDLASGFIQEIGKFIQNGGVAVFFPDKNGNVDSYNQLFASLGASEFGALNTNETRLAKVDFSNLLFENVFKKVDQDIKLPELFVHFETIETSRSSGEKILSAVSGEPILTKYQIGLGKFYVFAVPLNEEDGQLIRHPIFLPAIYNMAYTAQGASYLYQIITGGLQVELPLYINSIDKTLKIGRIGDDNLFVPELLTINNSIRLQLNGEIEKAGNYAIVEGDKAASIASFNYSRKESAMSCFTNTQINTVLEENGIDGYTILDISANELSEAIEEVDLGTNLWKLAIMMVLFFILIEILLVRFWDKIVKS